MKSEKILKEFYEIKGELMRIQGQGEILNELRDINNTIGLDKYINERLKKCWDESIPLAKNICDKNIELAEEYMKEGVVT